MSVRSDEGWDHYRKAESLYREELERGPAAVWTAVDYRLRSARDCAVRDGDSHLVGAALELQAARWELAGFQGEVLAALGGALTAYERIELAEHRIQHSDRVKQRLANWFEVPRVFVSYARHDARRVKTIVSCLTEMEPPAEVLWDANMFIPGVDLSHLISWVMDRVSAPSRDDVATLVSTAFRVAGIYLLMWSQTYATRPWTTWELDLVLDHLASQRRAGQVGPRVVVVRLDDAPLPVPLNSALWIDASRGLRGKRRDELRRAVTQTELLGPRLTPA